MKILAMEPTSFSSGIPITYRVVGLPEGQTAEITFKRQWSAEMWKIRFNGRGRLRGNYRTAEAALLALQAGNVAPLAAETEGRDGQVSTVRRPETGALTTADHIHVSIGLIERALAEYTGEFGAHEAYPQVEREIAFIEGRLPFARFEIVRLRTAVEKLFGTGTRFEADANKQHARFECASLRVMAAQLSRVSEK